MAQSHATEQGRAFAPTAHKVFYVYRAPEELKSHQGLLKIGDASLHDDRPLEELIASCEQADPERGFFTSPAIEAATHRRIKEQMDASGYGYELLWACLAVAHPQREDGSYDRTRWVPQRDHDLHNLMKRYNKTNSRLNDSGAKEWFKITLEEVQDFVHQLQTGEQVTRSKGTEGQQGIVLRREQEEAVDFTKKRLKGGTVEAPKEVLWNAIMRFGKTLTSYQVVREMSQDLKRVLIVTHRPVVASGWFEDFGKIFPQDDNLGYTFASKAKGGDWNRVKHQERFIYFASMQDLRGSFDKKLSAADRKALEEDNANSQSITEEGAAQVFTKNQDIFGTTWDLVITDEAHEGTKTSLARRVADNLKASHKLHLSGTPFNIVDDFDPSNVYTWDYVQEQEARQRWDEEQPGVPNPYATLPQLEIFTYNISEALKKRGSTEGVFDFTEFFHTRPKVDEDGKEIKDAYEFVRPKDVNRFLNLISKTAESKDSSLAMPFETMAMKRIFAHTFWLVPTIPAAKALKDILEEHSYFGDFHVVNVAGDNFDGDNALDAVQTAIREHDRTITLSVGRLTTGVTVPEWTAVFLLSNLRAPMLYMQTIFRAKSSGVLPNGQVKEKGYVFDFAPDRTLEMVAEAAEALMETQEELLKRSKKDALERDEVTPEEALGRVLQYLPIIGEDGVRFDHREPGRLMRQIRRVFINKTVNAGFETKYLYNFQRIRESTRDPRIMETMEKLQKTVGKQESTGASSVTVAQSELTQKDLDILEKDEKERKKPKEEREKLTPEEEQALKEAREKRKQENGIARELIKILNSVSVRIPLLVFAADLKGHGDRVTLDNFSQVIDDASWGEFMPKGFSKTADSERNYGLRPDNWEFVKQFYDKDVFEGACEAVRERVDAMDELPPLERGVELMRLFGTFRNPDKETVLTPAAVVDLQYRSTLGGLSFFDDQKRWRCEDGVARTLEEVHDGGHKVTPLWVDQGHDELWQSSESTFLDINSKTALYPLWAALGLFWHAVGGSEETLNRLPLETQKLLWRTIVERQIFVNCRVPYSRSIAERVLRYNREGEVNAAVVDILDLKKKLEASNETIKKRDKVERLTDDELSSAWRWIFDHKNFDRTEARARRVKSLMSKKSVEELRKVLKEEPGEHLSAVVSNPPYQSRPDSSGASEAVYHRMFDVSRVLSPLVSMVFPARWMLGGRGEGLPEFRRDELQSSSYAVFRFEKSGDDLFGTVTTGPVCIFLWSEGHGGPIRYIYDNEAFEVGTLGDGDGGREFVPSPKLRSLVRKVSPRASMDSIVHPAHYYGNHLKTTKMVERIQESPDGDAIIWYAKSKTIAQKRVDSGILNRSPEDYDVVVSSTSHPRFDGGVSRVDRAFIARPGEAFTSSFLKVGSFSSELEAANCLIYLKSDFCNFLHGQLTISQHSYANTYALIPLLDFATGEILDKPGTFLDFSKPETLDAQLAEIYGLTEEEQEMMRKDLKPWKDKVDVEADR